MEASGRRGFFVRGIYALWALIAGGLGVPTAGYLLSAPRSSKEGDWIEAGELARLPLGAPEEVVFRRNRVDGWKVTSEKSTAWLVKTGEQEVVAFAPQCPHLGCAFRYEERNKEFICPCHTSNFSLDGKVLSGPSPRPLDRYTVKIEHGKVLIGSLDNPLKSA